MKNLYFTKYKSKEVKRMAKSSELQLKNRGYIQDSDLLNYRNFDLPELIELSNSIRAFERTIAVRLILWKVGNYSIRWWS